jgi:hypothetical protein
MKMLCFFSDVAISDALKYNVFVDQCFAALVLYFVSCGAFLHMQSLLFWVCANLVVFVNMSFALASQLIVSLLCPLDFAARFCICVKSAQRCSPRNFLRGQSWCVRKNCFVMESKSSREVFMRARKTALLR